MTQQPDPLQDRAAAFVSDDQRHRRRDVGSSGNGVLRNARSDSNPALT
jgi:hypothetical protein